MSEPLAVVYYANLLPGSRLAGRLQDLGYRVRTIASLAGLAEVCAQEKPLVALVEISPAADGRAEIAALRANPATQHIPVVAFSGGARQGLPGGGAGRRGCRCWRRARRRWSNCRNCWTRRCKWIEIFI